MDAAKQRCEFGINDRGRSCGPYPGRRRNGDSRYGSAREQTDHVVSGHDGGVNVSNDGGENSTRFETLPVTQFYAITVDPSEPQRLYGGSQDNSTMRTMDGDVDSYEIFLGGDGFYCVVHPEDNDIILGEAQWGRIYLSHNDTQNFVGLWYYYDDDRRDWMKPFLLDPSNPDRLYIGTYRVWRTDINRLDRFEAISPDLTDGPGEYNLTFGTITTLDVAPSDSNVIYVGTDDSNVWVTEDYGDNWTNISETLPTRWVTRVVAHPDSASVVYVTFSGYREADIAPHIWRGDNYGETWTDASGDLPEAPINDLIIDPQNTAYLYAGTDFGVFYSFDYGQHWFVLGDGLPTSSVFDLYLIDSERTLVAGTHGRSMYTYPLETIGNSEPMPFSLIEPEDSTTFIGDCTGYFYQDFVWEECIDSDPMDTVFYTLYLQISLASPRDDTLYTFGNLSDTTFGFTPPDEFYHLDEDTTFHWWWVNAVSGGDSLESSERWRFNIIQDDVDLEEENVAPRQYQLNSLYPNPFNSSVTIQYRIPFNSSMEITIFDILGREAYHEKIGAVQPGNHTYTWHANVPTGIYFLELSSADGWSEIRKLIHLK